MGFLKRINPFFYFLLGFMVFAFLMGINPEQSAWNAAEEKNDVESYQAYLKAYPEGRRKRDADQRVERLREAAELKAKEQRTANRREKLLPVFSRLTRGEGVGQVEAYPAGVGHHPIILLTDDGALHEWDAELADRWRSDTVEKVQLAAILGKQEKVVLEVVPYENGFSIVRYQHTLPIRLLEAKSGKEIAKGLLESALPPPAPEKATFPGWGDRGSRVERPLVESWLKKFVDGAS